MFAGVRPHVCRRDNPPSRRSGAGVIFASRLGPHQPARAFDYADPDPEAGASLSNASSSEPSREMTAAYVDND